jgi:hypothetical protein
MSFTESSRSLDRPGWPTAAPHELEQKGEPNRFRPVFIRNQRPGSATRKLLASY